MKKFNQHIILFLLPVLLLIFSLPVNSRLKYIGLKDDCFNHGLWIHDRIFANDQPADIVFLGTSHTINGIDDKYIEQLLNDQDLHAVNLGYCRPGRNLQYILLKELLVKKQPSVVILEVRYDEPRYGHPIFPYMAATADVLTAQPFFNPDILKDMVTHGIYKLQLTQDFIYENGLGTALLTDDFGFASFNDTIPINLLNETVEGRRPSPGAKPGLADRFYMHYPISYLKKIYQLCKEHHIQLIFLYLPAYGTGKEEPAKNEIYQHFGELLISPPDILENPDYWYDVDHLNQAGAHELSSWLANKLQDIFSDQ